MKKRLLTIITVLAFILSMTFGASYMASAAVGTFEVYNAETHEKISVIDGASNIYVDVSFVAPKTGQAKILAAQYDKEGVMLSVSTVGTVDMTEGSLTETTSSVLKLLDAEAVKVFVWEDLTGMVPVIENPAVIARSVEKFEKKFTNDFIYRVGNKSAVSLGSLFKAAQMSSGEAYKINSAGVSVAVEKINENTTAGGSFVANAADWSKGTIQFSGTGLVKVTIKDDCNCLPTELYLEVVEAVNTTSAANAKTNNVVLLNDCAFSSLEVSGGYTLYGNGFKMTCASDSPALDMGYSFVTLNNGTLDNVQIICPDFDYAALYKSNLTSSENSRRQQTGHVTIMPKAVLWHQATVSC